MYYQYLVTRLCPTAKARTGINTTTNLNKYYHKPEYVLPIFSDWIMSYRNKSYQYLVTGLCPTVISPTNI
jgi:hypothetical protein